MSKKRYVDDSFWTDPYIEKLDTIEKCVFIYLLTNPLCNVAGIYEISLKRLAYDLGLDKQNADGILNRFVRDGKLLRVDDWIIMVNFGKHQVLNPNMEAGVRRIIGELPEKVKALKGFESLSYFTLLNLTYRTPHTKNTTEEHPTFFKQPKVKGGYSDGARKIIALFTQSTGGSFNNALHLDAAEDLVKRHGIDEVMSRAEFGLSLTPKEYQIEINKPVDVGDHWAKLGQLMKTPKKDSKYGIKY